MNAISLTEEKREEKVNSAASQVIEHKDGLATLATGLGTFFMGVGAYIDLIPNETLTKITMILGAGLTIVFYVLNVLKARQIIREDKKLKLEEENLRLENKLLRQQIKDNENNNIHSN